MNKSYFRALTRDRRDSLRLLQKTSMRGIRDSIVEKYSEPAHFIYELLQNADDVRATRVRFILRADGLYFMHNGTVRFNVTAPNQVEVGHINAITSIGNSSKSEQTNTIGKFGVGFKSVFQYTTTPHIYDPEVAFKITDFIVPVLLEETRHPLQGSDETLFYFPFDHPEKTAETAFAEIENKLKNLQYPALFLNHLRHISWQIHGTFGHFTLETEAEETIGDTRIERLTVGTQTGKKTQQTRFLKFSRHEADTNLKYSLVYLLDENDALQTADRHDLYCYFPTKVSTPFAFLLHAPFLLTDSREGIKTGEKWNRNLLSLLADLQADSVELLRDEKMLTEESFLAFPYQIQTGNRRNRELFTVFYEAFLRKMQQSVLLPTGSESFVSVARAYLPESRPLTELFPDNLLADLVKNPAARWVFPNLKSTTELWNFVKNNLTAPLEKLDSQGNINERSSGTVTTEYLVRRLTADFIAAQNETWLTRFYREMSERHRSLWQGESAILRFLPILPRDDGTVTAAFDPNTRQSLVWLPLPTGPDYPTVKYSLTEVPSNLTFFRALGLITPAANDEIQLNILPKYQAAQPTKNFDFGQDFEKIYQYYRDSNLEKAEKLLEQLREIPFLQGIDLSDGSMEFKRPQDLYFGTPRLQQYFKNASVSLLPADFIFTDDQTENERKTDFLRKLGVCFYPHFQTAEDEVSEEKKTELRQKETPEATIVMWETTTDFTLDGLENFLQTPVDLAQSVLLWEILQSVPTEYLRGKQLGTYTYQYTAEHQINFPAAWLHTLQTTPFLYDKNAVLHTPLSLRKEDLHSDYNLDHTHYLSEILFQKAGNFDRLAGLNAEELLAIELGKKFLQEGFSESDLQSLKAYKARKADREERQKRRKPEPKVTPPPAPDADEFNPAFLSSEELLAKQAELRRQLEAELEEKIDDLLQIEQLKNTIQSAEKYSYAWFTALLELEYILAFEQNDKDRSISIFFDKVEQEPGADKMLILKQPSRNLPVNIEETGDITLRLQLADERKILDVEVVSIRNTTLRAKLKSIDALAGVDFKKIRGATLVIQDTIFTLEELVKSFGELPFAPTDNLQTRLPEPLRFVFGPPGTGKTTYLAREEIMPILEGDEPAKILVLTPTNKAADVLVLKLLEMLPDIPESLMRFGVTTSDAIETAGLLKDSSFDFSDIEHCCVVTTITRFPYDGFNRGYDEFKLKNIDWDIILFDEASMITLAAIVHTIYQQPGAEFIIAGDPFQIEPIVFAEEWKGENIYNLVNLQSFDPELQCTQLTPHAFEVVNLETQYRAISSIGYLYSHLTYEGKLRHNRYPRDRRPLHLSQFPLKDVNVIRFPVHPLETLFRPQLLLRSHYHIYSALLTVETVKYLVRHISAQMQPKEKPWRIGIICPYKAQATLVDKVLSAQNLTDPKVRWQCGTIHSFQGDECEIILTLFNPPLHISKSPNMFLNKKNILNVAISRASDYLILLLPDTQTENSENLYQLNRLQSIIDYFIKGNCQKYDSRELEEILFGQFDFIEQNTFATTHQSVNVYVKPEKKYEIRCEERAVDVQVNEG